MNGISNSLLLAALCFMIWGGAAGQAEEMRTLPGHVPPAAALAQPLDRLPGTNLLQLALDLPLHHRDELTHLLLALYDPASPAYHHFLTPRQFTETFGPTTNEYQEVMDFAQTHGLAIAGLSANRKLLAVQGRAEAVEKAFHVHLRRFQQVAGQRTFYAPDVEPTLESSIPVHFVGGLNSYYHPQPASLHAVPWMPGLNPTPASGSAGGNYVGLDFRSAYVPGVTNTGAGQSVGLVEFDSYYASDVAEYLALPQTGLGGSSVTLSNVVLGGLTGSPGDGNVEVALDIDMAISMAPGLSTIYVYEATNADSSPDLVLNRIAADDLCAQVSCSWTGFFDLAIQDDFLQLAAQGQSFFQASGDSGAYTPNWGQNPVAAPSDNPDITVVGGTTLNTTGPAGSWISETTWSWFSQPFDGLSDAATSGGISPVWPLPAWQAGISMTGNQGSTRYRNLPDVSMVANELFLFANHGGQYAAGGTSAAAPLWAGLAALVNQQQAAQAQPSVGFLNPALYAIGNSTNYDACFHDITVGNNTNLASPKLYAAVPGYDLCTGWGTPNGSNLIQALSPVPLNLSPSAGLTAAGSYGGPFVPASLSLGLTNVAAAAFNWTLGMSASWLTASLTTASLTTASLTTASLTTASLTTASLTTGTLAAASATTVNLAFNNAATNLPVGVYTNLIWVTNVPAAAVQTMTCVLTISPAVPVLTWPQPATMNYGTALGAAQLDATADVPGTFAYSPAAGAILGAGTNLLTVVFTPADDMDYVGATNTVNLVVSAAVTPEPEGEPLLPAWGTALLLAGLAFFGAVFLRRSSAMAH
jgi:hypothetical protein